MSWVFDNKTHKMKLRNNLFVSAQKSFEIIYALSKNKQFKWWGRNKLLIQKQSTIFSLLLIVFLFIFLTLIKKKLFGLKYLSDKNVWFVAVGGYKVMILRT